jgi:hypothetical protein
MNRWRWILAVLALVTLLSFVGSASAQDPGDDSSAVDEYVEDVPTSEGDSSTGGGKPKRKSLPRSVVSQVKSEGGEDAAALEELATSSAFGAPQKQIKELRNETHGPIVKPEPEAESDGRDGLAAAAATAGTGGNGSRLIGLLIVLGVISAATVALARRARARR